MPTILFALIGLITGIILLTLAPFFWDLQERWCFGVLFLSFGLLLVIGSSLLAAASLVFKATRKNSSTPPLGHP